MTMGRDDRQPTVERRLNALILPDDISFEDWQATGQWLRSAERSLMWWIGDWLRFGESRWGERYAQAIEATGQSYQALADAKWVASRFEFSRRRENLSFSHHREVAALEPAAADHLLDEAVRDGLSRNELRAAVTGLTTNEPHFDPIDCPCCGHRVSAPSLEMLLDVRNVTTLEARILGVIWKGKGHPVATERIFDAMYWDDVDGGPERVHMYAAFKVALHHLRQRIEPVGVYIANVGYGAGYRLVTGRKTTVAAVAQEERAKRRAEKRKKKEATNRRRAA